MVTAIWIPTVQGYWINVPVDIAVAFGTLVLAVSLLSCREWVACTPVGRLMRRHLTRSGRALAKRLKAIEAR